MARFSPPPLRFPIGQFDAPGQREPVYVYPDQAFWDYITNVFERIGGESGLSSAEIVTLIETTAADAVSSLARRPAMPQMPDPVTPRSNAGEVQALRERVQSLESQLRSARSEQMTLIRALDDLRAEMRRIPSLAAMERRISDLEAVTL